MADYPNSDEEILAEVEELLGDPYEHAKKAHIWAEEESGEHNWLAMTNFRDALDHMAKIFDALEDGDVTGARENLGEMEAHIQRAAYDSAQSAVEQKLDEVIDKRLPSVVYKLTLVEHMPKDEFYNRKDKVSTRMARGREKKAEGMEASLKQFRSAHEHAKEMARGTPSRKEVALHSLIILGVIGTLLALVLSVV